MFKSILIFTLVVALTVAAKKEITENCISYGGYCGSIDRPCCWRKEETNGYVSYTETTCDVEQRMCNVYSDIDKFNKSPEYINPNGDTDLEIAYNNWIESQLPDKLYLPVYS